MNHNGKNMIMANESTLYWAIIALFASLVAGSIARFVALRNAGEEIRRKRFASLRTWWLLAIVLSTALLTGRIGICLLLASASCIAWFEITKFFGARPEDKLAIRSGYGLIAINYLLILFESISLFIIFLPIGSFIVLAVSLLIKGEPRGYIRSSGSLLWAIMFLGYGKFPLLPPRPWVRLAGFCSSSSLRRQMIFSRRSSVGCSGLINATESRLSSHLIKPGRDSSEGCWSS
jgi:hypothetical protein